MARTEICFRRSASDITDMVTNSTRTKVFKSGCFLACCVCLQEFSFSTHDLLDCCCNQLDRDKRVVLILISKLVSFLSVSSSHDRVIAKTGDDHSLDAGSGLMKDKQEKGGGS